jgi:hypothetical protein
MAGLGFGVEVAAVRRVGARVGLAVVGSLAFMIALVAVTLKVTGLGL